MRPAVAFLLSSPRRAAGWSVVVSVQPRPWPKPAEVIVVAVRAKYARREAPLAVQVRDRLGELFPDAEFESAFAGRGRPGWSPGRLALVTVLQMAEDLTDRQAAEAVRERLSWQYALGLDLDDPGFDHTVLSEFRARVVEHGLEERVLDLLLARLVEEGLVGPGGKQRTDSTHLVDACYRADAPGWLREVEAVQVLRVVLLQSYTRTVTETGTEVARREAERDGLPPGRFRLSSPYDTDARWGVKRDTFWNGYKVHLSETCDAEEAATSRQGDGAGARSGPCPSATAGSGQSERSPQRPNLITNVATTDATVPDHAMTKAVHHALDRLGLLPAEHYVDSGYPSAELVADAARDDGIALISPMLLDTSRQARAGTGLHAAAFTIDWDSKPVTCPQGQRSSSWSPATQRGTEAIVVKFAASTCGPCPVHDQCTTAARGGRQLTLKPQPLHETLQTGRAEQDTTDWQARYAIRAGVEGTMHQAITVTGTRNARYKGLAKTHLEHVYSAVALNLIRLDAWWNGHPLDRRRTSHLARLELALAA